MFVDKFCINQTDEAQKRQGVLSIPGFLHSSRRLVICWTPRYFTRLWCIFEVASWKNLQKPVEDVLLVPSSQASIFFTLLCFVSLFHMSSLALQTGVAQLTHALLATSAWCVFGECVRRSVDDMLALPKQLESFSIKDSACFCCSKNHLMPDTGQPIECDRRLIYSTLQDWYKSSDDSSWNLDDLQDKTLLRFDHFVRQDFAPWVLARVGSARLPYRQVIAASCPMLWAIFDSSVSFGTSLTDTAIRVVPEMVCTWCLVVPLSINALIILHVELDRIVTRQSWGWCARTLTRALTTPIPYGISKLPLSAMNARMVTLWPSLLWSMTLLVFTIFVCHPTPVKLLRKWTSHARRVLQ